MLRFPVTVQRKMFHLILFKLLVSYSYALENLVFRSLGLIFPLNQSHQSEILLAQQKHVSLELVSETKSLQSLHIFGILKTSLINSRQFHLQMAS